jgi:hypothetical protein
MERLGDGKAVVTADLINAAIRRNFGGQPDRMNFILDTFLKNLGKTERSADVREISRVDLITQNLQSEEARHLMLLTKNSAALPLLLDNNTLDDDVEVIFGSDFPDDQNDLQIVVNIQRIKQRMAQKSTVVLIHCDALYESLYDLLNQHYMRVGDKLYVRLAFGTHTRQCEIHKGFRVIVIVEKVDAYEPNRRLAPPLLNRFEKQVLERYDLLDSNQLTLLQRVNEFVEKYMRFNTAERQTKNADMGAKMENAALRSAFCGFHPDMMSSLVQSLPKTGKNFNAFDEAIRRLLWIATPESVCAHGMNNDVVKNEFDVDPNSIYFQDQHHRLGWCIYVYLHVCMHVWACM